MKTKNLFVCALAAMTFAACSNDDSPAAGGNEGNGEIIDAISVAFTNPKNTYAYEGTVDGKGTENNIYEAYIFAKENNPGHAGAMTGDWTVKYVDNAGSAIPEGVKGNVATFNGVRQGDNVYVIVNDPNLTMTSAQELAHKGSLSEASIVAYISGTTKKYLNGLAVKQESDQAGKFIMAGKATIPVNPTVENGGTVIVPVGLDRELAKVTFTGSVTQDTDAEAFGKVEIKEEDGLIIARVARKVSFFTTQDRDWYFPYDGDATTKDWGYDVNGDDEWLVAFNGINKANPSDASEAGPAFNDNMENSTAREYRFTWDGKSALVEYTEPNTDPNEDGGRIISPFFYVTPNYANSSACATVIVTQATYTGPTALVSTVNEDMLKDARDNGSIDISDWSDTDNLNDMYGYLTTTYPAIFTSERFPNAASLIGYTPGDKLYYRADIANYKSDNTTSENVTERNTFYQIKGTITSLGAKSIEEAIENNEISMIVQVTVKPWNVVVNHVNM